MRSASLFWKVAKWAGLVVLLLALGSGAFVCGKFQNIADEDHEARCADVARGKAVVAEVSSIAAASKTCPVQEMQARTHAADGPGPRDKWSIDINPRDCSYTLRTFTRSGWPIGASVRLDYDSRSKKWELLCQGDRSRIECP